VRGDCQEPSSVTCDGDLCGAGVPVAAVDIVGNLTRAPPGAVPGVVSEKKDGEPQDPPSVHEAMRCRYPTGCSVSAFFSGIG